MNPRTANLSIGARTAARDRDADGGAGNARSRVR